MTIEAALEAVRLKALSRAGWVRKGVVSPESVAAHSWGVSLLVLALLPPDLDRGRALAYATLHDLAEVRVGDITPFDGVSEEEKADRERRAMQALGQAGLPDELVEIWEAYEAQADPEARFVRQCDRLDMAVQAVAYAAEGASGMEEFVDAAARVVTHPRLVARLEALRRRLDAR